MSMNGVNLNNLSLAEKIKLMQLQKNGGNTTATKSAQNNSMNTSIFNSIPTRSANSTQSTQGTQNTQGIGTVKAGTENIFSKLNASSTTSTTSTNGSEALYENPEKLNTPQEISKAQTLLQTKMAQEGSNMKLEMLSLQLDLRREQISGTSGENGTQGTNSTNSTQTQELGTSQADGDAAVKESEAGQKDVETKSKESEKDQTEAKDMAKEAKAENKALKKDSKTLNKQMKSAQKTMTKSQQEMAKLTEEMDNNQKEIDDALNQINTLQAAGNADSTGAGEKSAFSLKLAGEAENTPKSRSMNSTASTGATQSSNSTAGSSDDKASQINELTAKIDEKSSANEQIGVKMNTIQTKQNSAVTTMQHTVQMKNKYYLKAQKNLQGEEKLADKMLKVEQKINDVAQTVEQVGDITEKVGKGMQVAGNAMAASPCPPVSAAGIALARAGGVTQKVGVVTQNVGQYGQLAAQTAMTFTYAAKGDIGNALTSAGGAVQVGASAVKGTKQMKSDMKEINNSVQEGLDKANVSRASKQAAEQAKEAGNLNGLSKKEYAAGVKDQLNAKIEDGSLKKEDLFATTKADDAGKQINGMIDQDKLKTDAAQKAAQKGTAKAGGNVFKKAGDWIVENGDKAGQSLTKLGNQVNSLTGKNGNANTNNVATNPQQTVRPDFSNREKVFKKKFG